MYCVRSCVLVSYIMRMYVIYRCVYVYVCICMCLSVCVVRGSVTEERVENRKGEESVVGVMHHHYMTGDI